RGIAGSRPAAGTTWNVHCWEPASGRHYMERGIAGSRPAAGSTWNVHCWAPASGRHDRAERGR
ncbi:hypothetical protein, partial [Stenotrophomonas sp. P5_B8]